MNRILLLAVFVTALLSCKKTENINSTQDDVLLKKFALIDNDSNDTLFIYNFTYDALQRCTNIDVADRGIGEEYSYTNFYNGNDTTIQHSDILGVPMEGEYFTYDASGLLVKDSLFDGSFSLVYNYSRAGNRIEGTVTASGQPFLRSVHTQQLDASGNVTYELDSSWTYNAPTGSEDFDAEIENIVSYDNAPNPFYRIFPGRSVIMAYENWRELPMNQFFKGRNNIRTQKRNVTSPGSTSYSAFNDQYVYTYNSNGYPTSVIYTDLEFGGNYKGIYYY